MVKGDSEKWRVMDETRFTAAVLAVFVPNPAKMDRGMSVGDSLPVVLGFRERESAEWEWCWKLIWEE